MKRKLKYILIVIALCSYTLFWCYVYRVKEHKYHVYYKTNIESGRAIVTLNEEITSIVLCNLETDIKKDLEKKIPNFDPNNPLIIVSWQELKK